ncbi:MAG: hypothetical protein ABSB78_09815 [Bacteroidota bacterium]
MAVCFFDGEFFPLPLRGILKWLFVFFDGEFFPLPLRGILKWLFAFRCPYGAS